MKCLKDQEIVYRKGPWAKQYRMRWIWPLIVLLILFVLCMEGVFTIMFKQAQCGYCTPTVCWSSMECEAGCSCFAFGPGAGTCVSMSKRTGK